MLRSFGMSSRDCAQRRKILTSEGHVSDQELAFYFSLVFYILGAFYKTIIQLALAGYEMTGVNSVLRTMLAIYHF